MSAKIAFVDPKDPLRLDSMLEMAKSEADLDLDIIEAGLSAEEWAARCRQYEIIILGSRTPMQLLLSCDRLKFLQLMAAGFDAYDIGALNAKSVVVANNADAIAISVAEHTILLMLAVKHRFGDNWLSAQRGKWDGMGP